jgi:hypothetical protein
MVPARSGNPAALVAQGDRRPAALRRALSSALPLSATENRLNKKIGTLRRTRRLLAARVQQIRWHLNGRRRSLVAIGGRSWFGREAQGCFSGDHRCLRMPVGCQYSVRIWESGEWQTRTAECRRRSANPLPRTQMVIALSARKAEHFAQPSLVYVCWSGKRDSNSRPSAWEELGGPQNGASFSYSISNRIWLLFKKEISA